MIAFVVACHRVDVKMSRIFRSFMDRLRHPSQDSDGQSTSYTREEMELTGSEPDNYVYVGQPTGVPVFREQVTEGRSGCLLDAPGQVGSMGIAQLSLHDDPVAHAKPQRVTSNVVPTTMACTTVCSIQAMTQQLTYALTPAPAHTTPVYTLAQAATLPAVHPSYCRFSTEAPTPATCTPVVPPCAPHPTDSVSSVPYPTVYAEHGPTQTQSRLPTSQPPKPPMTVPHATLVHAPTQLPSAPPYRQPLQEGPVFPPSMPHHTQHLSGSQYAPRDATHLLGSQRLGDANIPRYNGKADFTDFKYQFECFAEDFGWDNIQMGRMLSRCLIDDARTVLGGLRPEVRRDYDTLCNALMALHSTPGGEAVKRNQLHQATRKEGQSISAFAKDLRTLASKAYPNDKLLDAALVQIFIRGLNYPGMEAHVGMQCPLNLEEAIRHASNFEAYAHNLDGVGRKPKVVNAAKAGALSSDELGNFKTGVVEQLDVVKQQFEGVNRKLEEMYHLFMLKGAHSEGTRCFHCSGYGHFASSCPLKQSQQSQRATVNPSRSGPYRHPNSHKRTDQQLYKDYRQANVVSTNTQATANQVTTFPEDQNRLNCQWLSR